MKYLALLLLCFLLPSQAKEVRSYKAKAAFVRQYLCPNPESKHGTCKGYVVDHVIALACGGKDTAENMQWQTVAEGKAKDKWERLGCNKKE